MSGIKISKVLSHKRNDNLNRIDALLISEREKSFAKEFIENYISGEITQVTATNIPRLKEAIIDALRIALPHLANTDNLAKILEEIKNLRHSIKREKDIKKLKILHDKLQDCENLAEDNIEKYKESILAFKKDILAGKIKVEIKNKKNEIVISRNYGLKTIKSVFGYLKNYIKSKYPDNPELLSPLEIKIKIKKETRPRVTEQEIDLLYKNCTSDTQRYIIANLFGTGTRIEEFMNIRYSDYSLPGIKENYVHVTIRPEWTKTNARTNPIFYKKCLEATRDFLESRKREGCEPEEPLLNMPYQRLLKWLRSLGLKHLHKSISPHMFRRGCADFVAPLLNNEQQLDKYMGWELGSPMAKEYMDRNSIEIKEIENKAASTELEELKMKLERQDNEFKLKNEQLKVQMAEIISSFEDFRKSVLTSSQKDIHELQEVHKASNTIQNKNYFKLSEK